MSISQLFSILTNFLGQIYHLGDSPLFGNVTINDFWFGFAIMAVLITTLIVFGKSVPITSYGDALGVYSRSKVDSPKAKVYSDSKANKAFLFGHDKGYVDYEDV